MEVTDSENESEVRKREIKRERANNTSVFSYQERIHEVNLKEKKLQNVQTTEHKFTEVSNERLGLGIATKGITQNRHKIIRQL